MAGKHTEQKTPNSSAYARLASGVCCDGPHDLSTCMRPRVTAVRSRSSKEGPISGFSSARFVSHSDMNV